MSESEERAYFLNSHSIKKYAITSDSFSNVLIMDLIVAMAILYLHGFDLCDCSGRFGVTSAKLTFVVPPKGQHTTRLEMSYNWYCMSKKSYPIFISYSQYIDIDNNSWTHSRLIAWY